MTDSVPFRFRPSRGMTVVLEALDRGARLRCESDKLGRSFTIDRPDGSRANYAASTHDGLVRREWIRRLPARGDYPVETRFWTLSPRGVSVVADLRARGVMAPAEPKGKLDER